MTSRCPPAWMVSPSSCILTVSQSALSTIILTDSTIRLTGSTIMSTSSTIMLTGSTIILTGSFTTSGWYACNRLARKWGALLFCKCHCANFYANCGKHGIQQQGTAALPEKAHALLFSACCCNRRLAADTLVRACLSPSVSSSAKPELALS